MAEFSDLGQYCHACKRIDFLPFTCVHCNFIFCKEHRFVDLHQCAQSFDPASVLIDRPEKKVHRKCHYCHVDVPNSHELVQCDHCTKWFGLCHRLPEVHQCAPFQQTVEQALIKATAQRSTPHRPISVPKVKGTKNEALARKVQLIKLKQSAVGVRAIPFSERIHLNVHVILSAVPGSNQTRELRYFLCNQWAIGRAVDYLAVENKLVNRNNQPGHDLLVLSDRPEGTDYYAFDRTLVDLQQQPQPSLFDGGTVYLRYVTRSSFNSS